MNGQFLEGQSSESYIETDSRSGFEEQHPISQGKLAGVWNSSLEMLKKDIDELVLPAESGQQGQVDIDRFPRLPPALQSQSTNEAELQR